MGTRLITSVVYGLLSIDEMRQRRQADMAQLDPRVRQLIRPRIYAVSLTEGRWSLKHEMIALAM